MLITTKSQHVPLHCTTCQCVECLLLVLFLLMPLVGLLVHGFATLVWEGQLGGWHVKRDCVLWYHRFHVRICCKPGTLILNPSLLPLICVAHLSAIQSTDVGSSLRSWICTCAWVTYCEGHHLLISNGSPNNYAFYISLEAELFWIWDRAPRNWYYSINLLMKIYKQSFMHYMAMVTSKFVSIHRFLIIVNIFLANNGILHLDAWGFVHVGNLMCWLPPNQHGRICWPLQCHLFEIQKGRWGELHSYMHLVDVPYIDIIFHVSFLSQISSELKYA